MSYQTLNYPSFDLLETQFELEYKPRLYQKLSPVKVGDVIIDLLKHQTQNIFLSKNDVNRKGQIAPYLHKTLIIYFYSKQWGSTSLGHLKQLNAIRNDVKYHDGNLLIIDTDEPNSGISDLLWTQNLILPTYADPHQNIAKLFGIYSENSPAWISYAGIDQNASLPAVFVVDHFLRVVYAHANEAINTSLSVDRIVDSVYQSNHYQSGKKSA